MWQILDPDYILISSATSSVICLLHSSSSVIGDSIRAGKDGIESLREGVSEALIHQSNRGMQYANYGNQSHLKQDEIASSISRRGICYDNAYIEAFFGSLKKEFVCREKYRTRQKARLSILEYAEVFYNRIRRHLALGYKSPAEYENRLNATYSASTILGEDQFGRCDQFNLDSLLDFRKDDRSPKKYNDLSSWLKSENIF